MFGQWILLMVLCIYVTGQDPAVVLPQGRIAGVSIFAFMEETIAGSKFTQRTLSHLSKYFTECHTHDLQLVDTDFRPLKDIPAGKEHFSLTAFRQDVHKSEIVRMTQSVKIVSSSISGLQGQHADTKSSLPVVVILYSESWSEGAASPLPCEDLATEGVVVVTVAYRLHLLAFFTLRSVQARGNLALLDQYLALVWIRENIAAFGGDPTSVSLMGHSAGADSVLVHIASQRSVGLFQRAIIMSPRHILRGIEEDAGSSNEIENISREMARELRCAADSDDKIVQCLRSRSLPEILQTYKKSNWSDAIQPIPDVYLPDSEQYLPKSLANALLARQPTAQLDLLVGAADLEAINFNHGHYEELSQQGSQAIMEYAKKKALPEIFQALGTQQSPVLTEAVLWEFWGGNSQVGSTAKEALRIVEGLARAQTSSRWGVGTALLAARFARRFSRLYVYRYSQQGVDLHGRLFNFTGAVHGTDLVTLLGDAMLLQVCRRPANPVEQRMSATLRRYFVNFIKFGSPAPESEWPRYRVGEAFVNNIRDALCGDHLANRDVAFWLQYLPRLVELISAPERLEQQSSTGGEFRLRGGVFAMCGVTALLLLLLCACAAMLHWERRRKLSGDSYDTNIN